MEIKEQLSRFKSVRNIIHLVNKSSLFAEYNKQKYTKSKGVDKQTNENSDLNVAEDIDNLLLSMRKMQYRPQPVRRTIVPIQNDKLKPASLPSYLDKLVQGVMSNILNEIYEQIFLHCSYGFRTGRGRKDAIKSINNTIMSTKVNWSLEAEITPFFDHKGFLNSENYKWLIKFLKHIIKDLTFIRYIVRFLSGIMEAGINQGTAQPGLISPILVNVYLHYVLDLWVVNYLKQRCQGEVYYVRSAYDFVILFENEPEAGQAQDLLKAHLAKFSLEVAADKTKILPLDR